MITSRRNFLKTTAFGSASLIIGFDGLRLLKGANAETNLFEPSNWIRVDADGAVSLTIGKCEMGQGVRTSLAMILAEELEADWTKIRLVQAKPSPGSDLELAEVIASQAAGGLCDKPEQPRGKC